MTEASTDDRAFSAPEVAELPSYRPLNRLCLLVLMGGIASAATLIHPLFLFVPLGTLLLSIVAFRTLTPEQIGKQLAVGGLILAVLFGAWGPARYASRQRVLYREAARVSEQWLEVLAEGKRLQAHQLTLPVTQRLARGESLEEHYSEDTVQREISMDQPPGQTPYDTLEAFYVQPPMPAIEELGPGFEAELVQNLGIERTSSVETTISLQYRIYAPERPQEAVEAVVMTERFVDKGDAFWRVKELITPEDLRDRGTRVSRKMEMTVPQE